MKRSKDLTPADRIERAKRSIDGGAPPGHAIAHTLIAIAELLTVQVVRDITEPEPAAATEAAAPIVDWPHR